MTIGNDTSMIPGKKDPKRSGFLKVEAEMGLYICYLLLL